MTAPPKKPGWQRFADMVPEAVRDEAVAVLEAHDVTTKKIRSKQHQQRACDAFADEDDEEAKAYREHVEAEKADRKKNPESARARADRMFNARGAKLHKRMVAHVQRYRDLLRSLGQLDAAPFGVPPHVWRTEQVILADATGKMAKIILSQLPPAVARRIKRAALEPKPYQPKRVRRGRELRKPRRQVLDGSRRYWEAPGKRHWWHPTAIRTVACGVTLWQLGRDTKRSGFKHVTRGYSRGILCELLQDPMSGVAPSKSQIAGSHHDVPGEIRALEQAGVFRVNQPPGSKVEASDRGPTGYAMNVYWWFPWVAGKDGDEELMALSAPGIRAELGLEPEATGPP